MTENEAKRPKIVVIGGGRNSGRTLKAHIDLLEELEQYRAIGTVEEFKALKDCGTHNCMIKHLSGECSYKETGCSDCKSKWKIKDLLEKSEPKKPEVDEFDYGEGFVCGECESFLHYVDDDDEHIRTNYCCHCGTRIDWSE